MGRKRVREWGGCLSRWFEKREVFWGTRKSQGKKTKLCSLLCHKPIQKSSQRCTHSGKLSSSIVKKKEGEGVCF